MGSFCTNPRTFVCAKNAKTPRPPRKNRIADFSFGARCAPHRANAQRAAPFGNVGIIGFVLHDLQSRGSPARIHSYRHCLRSDARTRARRPAPDCRTDLSCTIATPLPTRRCCAFDGQKRSARGDLVLLEYQSDASAILNATHGVERENGLSMQVTKNPASFTHSCENVAPARPPNNCAGSIMLSSPDGHLSAYGAETCSKSGGSWITRH